MTASSDGTRVLLSNGSVYETTTEPAVKLFDLTKGHGGFMGVAAASADLKTVYFVDSEVVAPQQGPTHAVAQAGQPNLYVYEAAAGAVRFIGTLAPEDGHHGQDALLGTWTPAPQDRLAQTTPNGRYLAFDSVAPITGYDNNITSGNCGTPGVTACSEVYLYDELERTLRCVSCNPAALPPAGASSLSLLQPIVSRFPQPHNLTSAGRVFFNSFDQLSAGDHFPGVENVWEFEQDGQGTCGLPSGCLAMISTGRSSFDASFLSADELGADIFFTTRQQVLPKKTATNSWTLRCARRRRLLAHGSPRTV